LSQGQHYLEVTAVSWFINKQGNWLQKLMASGTLDINLADGQETYQVALGTYELRGGARIAPVFNEPVLPERVYRGGHLAVSASMTIVQRDEVIATLLKSAASASLGVVAGMVQTATIAGPSKILGAAGQSLITGVNSVLSTGDKKISVFASDSFKDNLKGEDFVGAEMYLLMHRGSDLNQSGLSVKKTGQLDMPYLDDRLLDDGAWLLLKLTRTTTYHGVRDWFESAKNLRQKVKGLVDDFDSPGGLVSKDEALKLLSAGGAGNPTYYDEFVRLRGIIYNDGVLSEGESSVYVTALRSVIEEARKSITQGKPGDFVVSIADIQNGLATGKPNEDVAQHLDQVFRSIVSYRSDAMPENLKKGMSRIPSLALGKGVDFGRTTKMAFAIPKPKR
jgi:hypothetical protein